MARASWLVIAAVALALSPAPARAQDERVRVAVYAPWSGPATADERYAFGLEIEQALENTGRKADVKTFVKLRDFRRVVSGGGVDIVLVDVGAVSLLGKRFAVVASWSSGDRWVLAGAEQHADLTGQRLALQAHDARSSAELVARLLRGVVTSDYWSRIVSAPVTQDARQLVARGIADVVLLPKPLLEDMTELVDLGTFTEIVVAADNPRSQSDAVDAVREAVRARFGGTWTDGEPRLPAPVTATKLVPASAGDDRTPDVLTLLAPPDDRLPKLPLGALWTEPDEP